MSCTNCGADVTDKAKFCPKCEEEIKKTPPQSIPKKTSTKNTSSPKSANATTKTQTASKLLVKTWLYPGIISLLIIILVICAIVFPHTSFVTDSSLKNPTDLFNQLESAYNNHDINEIIECYEPDVRDIINDCINIRGGVMGINGCESLESIMPFLGEPMKYSSSFTEHDWGQSVFSEHRLSGNEEGIEEPTGIGYDVLVTFQPIQSARFYCSSSVIKIDNKWYLTISPQDITKLELEIENANNGKTAIDEHE